MDKAVWDPIQQIYVGGKVPGATDDEVKKMVNDCGLRVLGYGSLTWKPSGWLQNGVPGRVYGYRRAWAQKSTDHRGTPDFPGLVCTLLTDGEFRSTCTCSSRKSIETGFVDGLVYHVPDHHVDECLKDLDFREKGGYAREIVEVVDTTTEESYPCLIYRGTPDNPAFWPRALNDLNFAASVIAVAVGPSGPNLDYLQPLANFLADKKSVGDDTLDLWEIVQTLQPGQLNFFTGCGSNQYGQLLTDPEDVDELHSLSELVYTSKLPIAAIFAGGGHTAVLDDQGNLQFFGWNEFGQAPVEGLANVRVASLGFSHTVVIDKLTNELKAFGDDRYHQVSSITGSGYSKMNEFTSVSAGLFHTAAITTSGAVIIFQKDRVWEFVLDDSKAVKVVCGKHLTVVLDSNGRLWSSATSNKHQELGRDGPYTTFGLVQNIPDCIVDVVCGWSHCLALSKDGSVYGWGRNDKGQIGNEKFSAVARSIACGSESSYVVDCNDTLWSTGWNEHGNLAIGNAEDSFRWRKVDDASFKLQNKKIAVGGAHVLVYSTSFGACKDEQNP